MVERPYQWVERKIAEKTPDIRSIPEGAYVDFTLRRNTKQYIRRLNARLTAYRTLTWKPSKVSFVGILIIGLVLEVFGTGGLPGWFVDFLLLVTLLLMVPVMWILTVNAYYFVSLVLSFYATIRDFGGGTFSYEEGHQFEFHLGGDSGVRTVPAVVASGVFRSIIAVIGLLLYVGVTLFIAWSGAGSTIAGLVETYLIQGIPADLAPVIGRLVGPGGGRLLDQISISSTVIWAILVGTPIAILLFVLVRGIRSGLENAYQRRAEGATVSICTEFVDSAKLLWLLIKEVMWGGVQDELDRTRSLLLQVLVLVCWSGVWFWAFLIQIL